MKIPSIPLISSLEGLWSQLARLLTPVPSLSYGAGVPQGNANVENDLYFDTTVVPYHAYVFHQGSWNKFS